MTGVQLTDFSTQTQHCLKEIVPDSLDEHSLNVFFYYLLYCASHSAVSAKISTRIHFGNYCLKTSA